MPTRPNSRRPEPPSRAIPGPPPLAIVDFEAFRRELAGLSAPGSKGSAITPVAIKEMAIRFVTILAELFGDDLDRLTLWGRIDTALATSLARVGSSDDVDLFASLCLDHVKADAGRSAACQPLLATLDTFGRAPAEDRQAFLAYFRDHRYPAIVFGRQRWDRVKKKEVEL